MPSGLRGAKLLFNHRLMEGIEDAVYERAGILAGEFLGEVDRFVKDDLGRRVGGAQLVHGEAQDGAIDSGEAVEAPVFRVLDDDFIQQSHFFAAPSNKRLAKSRVVSAAFALRQNFASSLAGSCWLMSHWKSICMANSRDFLRSDMLPAARLSGRSSSRCRGRRFSAGELSRETGHFNGGETGFKAFVAALEAGAVDGLLESVVRQHAKDDGEAGVHLRELQSARGFRANVIVMRGLASENAANGDERIVTAGGG